jgi:hypothetical protein
MIMPDLTLTEEVVLLALDDQTGAALHLPYSALSYGLAGAVLADLALAGKIDTDDKSLSVINATALGDPLLDPWLSLLAGEKELHPVAYWLSILSQKQREIEQPALDRLIARGILRLEDKKILWVIGRRRYPTVDGHERTEVRTRLGRLVLGEDLPDPREAILIGLLCGCRITDNIFPEPEFAARSDRLATLAKLDLVGREVAAATSAAVDALASARTSAMTHM